jgi:hypothetical protein
MGRTIAKDGKLLSLSSSNLSQQGQQVEGNALGVLAHDAQGVGAAGVEVSEESAVPLCLAVLPLGGNVVGDDLLNHDLGSAVGVGGVDGAVLGDGDEDALALFVLVGAGVAVDGGRGREDNVAGVLAAAHGAQQGDAAADIDAVVLEGDLAGLANGLADKHVSNHTSLNSLWHRLTLRAAKWITLSISGCLAKMSSRAFSSVTSAS